MATYLIHGRRLSPNDAGLQDALASAHASRHRPLCLCRPEGLPMYVARLRNGFLLKRMPDTGCGHAADCPTYEPPPELSGLGELKGSAIVEDAAAGVTSLRLAFALAKGNSRSNMPAGGDGSNSVASDGSKLTMTGLLHYLWDQAELTRWQPAFAGRRSWAVVRKHLLLAAEGKIARGRSLQDQLYIPEVFSVEQRDEINARRIARWSHAASHGQRSWALLLLIGEVKEIVRARFGFKAIIKHVPDQAFALDEGLYRRMSRRFEPELAQWSASENLHLVMMATFGVGAGGVPTIDELTVMAVTSNWIPVSDAYEQQLVERLLRDGRRFVKSLRYNLSQQREIATAVLTDAEGGPIPLFIASRRCEEPEPDTLASGAGADCRQWVWQPEDGPQPSLPPAEHRRPERIQG
jgi:hypothetical protein